jgi:hypothetical protein
MCLHYVSRDVPKNPKNPLNSTCDITEYGVPCSKVGKKRHSHHILFAVFYSELDFNNFQGVFEVIIKVSYV